MMAASSAQEKRFTTRQYIHTNSTFSNRFPRHTKLWATERYVPRENSVCVSVCIVDGLVGGWPFCGVALGPKTTLTHRVHPPPRKHTRVAFKKRSNTHKQKNNTKRFRFFILSLTLSGGFGCSVCGVCSVSVSGAILRKRFIYPFCRWGGAIMSSSCFPSWQRRIIAK